MGKKKHLQLDEPLKHPNHKRPVTRRDLLAQGFIGGSATVAWNSLFGLFANPRAAHADLSAEIASCGIATQGAGKIPFICFDLAGGVNISGSNVLVGGQGGQLDFLSTAGYSKLGLPGDMIPSIVNPDSQSNDFVNNELGLAFHSDSAFLAGILEKVSIANRAFINGCIIPARSDNDTGNNPHNPMYGIAKTGADGSLLTLIGSRNTDSGGNSMSPSSMIDLSVRPTKVDRPSDVTGLVDVGDLVGLLTQDEAVAVMESIYRISASKIDALDTKVAEDAVIKDLVKCGYVKAADIANRFGNPATLDPASDPDIVGAEGSGSIFTTDEFNGDGEFRKTAAVMKMVINGFAGAGCITMGGYDYHVGDRATGEIRDLRAGRCMGACLEYAAKVGVPLMLYVMSDGSVFSNGSIDNSEAGRGKGEWTGDNSSTAASFFLVYNPGSQPVLIDPLRHQIGYMRTDASVETAATPCANNVNSLVETVILNYMALHGTQGDFASLFPNHGLGNETLQDSLTAFQTLSSIANGVISV